MRKNFLKLIILCSTGYAVVRMLHWPMGFTFFTQLSNLYVAAVVFCQMVSGRPFRLWKYTAVVSILITFLVYLFVLAPMEPKGIAAAYRQDHYASLCLHLITPFAATADFLLHDADYPWERKHLGIALLPPVAYLLFILTLGQAGVRWGARQMIAPYPFLNYNAPAGWFGFRPDTKGYTTLGIGVFYAILMLLALFLAVGWVLQAIVRRQSKNAG